MVCLMSMLFQRVVTGVGIRGSTPKPAKFPTDLKLVCVQAETPAFSGNQAKPALARVT